MLPWKLRKRQFLPVDQNLLSVHFSLAKFQLVSSNLSLAMIWQITYNQKLPKLCSATLSKQGAHQMEPPSSLISWVNPFPSRFINRTACFLRKVSYFRETRMSPWKNKVGWSRTQKPVLRQFSFFTEYEAMGQGQRTEDHGKFIFDGLLSKLSDTFSILR